MQPSLLMLARCFSMLFTTSHPSVSVPVKRDVVRCGQMKAAPLRHVFWAGSGRVYCDGLSAPGTARASVSRAFALCWPAKVSGLAERARSATEFPTKLCKKGGSFQALWGSGVQRCAGTSRTSEGKQRETEGVTVFKLHMVLVGKPVNLSDGSRSRACRPVS